jgi:hypothetical protein
MTKRFPAGTEMFGFAATKVEPSARDAKALVRNGCRAGLSISRTGSGLVVSIFTVLFTESNFTVLFAKSRPTVGVPEMETLEVAGKLETATVGVPLIPTFHVPLC